MVKKRAVPVIILILIVLFPYCIYATEEANPKFDPEFDNINTQNQATIEENIDKIFEQGRENELTDSQIEDINMENDRLEPWMVTKIANRISPDQFQKAKELGKLEEEALGKVEDPEVFEKDNNRGACRIFKNCLNFENPVFRESNGWNFPILSAFFDLFGAVINLFFEGFHIGLDGITLTEDDQLVFKDGTTIDLTSMEGKTITIKNGSVVMEERDELTGAVNVVGNPDYDPDKITDGKGWNYKIDSVKTLQRGTLTILNAEDVYVNEYIEFSHADTVINNGTIAVNVDNYTGILGQFYVDKADMVMNDNIIFYNVTKSGFTVYENALKATPDFNVTLLFSDSMKN